MDFNSIVYPAPEPTSDVNFFLESEDPEGIPVPYLMSGGTDNKALSELGIIGYGFSPLKLSPELDFMALFHGVDERVEIEGLTFGVRVLSHFLENC